MDVREPEPGRRAEQMRVAAEVRHRAGLEKELSVETVRLVIAAWEWVRARLEDDRAVYCWYERREF
jgi:hypothetical protein